MRNHTSEQIEEAVDFLPLEVQQMLFHPNTEYEVQRVVTDAGFTADQIKTLNVFANFILMGLLDEKDFEIEIKNNFNISEMQAKEVAEKILKEVISPIIEFKEKIILRQKAEEEARILDEAEYAEIMKEKEIENLLGQKESVGVSEDEGKVIPVKTLEKMPDIAPDNLPTGEEAETVNSQQLIVNSGEEAVNSQQLIVNREENTTQEVNNQQPIVNSGETHPFEEKMKKVFTGASTTIGDLAIETPTPEKNVSISSDPYREPIV